MDKKMTYNYNKLCKRSIWLLIFIEFVEAIELAILIAYIYTPFVLNGLLYSVIMSIIAIPEMLLLINSLIGRILSIGVSIGYADRMCTYHIICCWLFPYFGYIWYVSVLKDKNDEINKEIEDISVLVIDEHQ